MPDSEIRAWRFRVPAGVVEFHDEVFGEISQNVSADVGDFVIRRETPEREYAYQLAVVVDDALQGVTQVVRGADLIGSTARQIALAEALGYSRPRYAHLPLLVSRLGEKLSKRSGETELSRALEGERRNSSRRRFSASLDRNRRSKKRSRRLTRRGYPACGKPHSPTAQMKTRSGESPLPPHR